MRYSLQFRLLVAFTLVILLTIGSVFFMMWQAAIGQIQQFGDRVERMVGNRIQFVVTDYYMAHGSWEGVQPLVEQIGEQFRHRVILADAGGKIIADSSTETPANQLSLDTFSSRTLTSSHERRDSFQAEPGGAPPSEPPPLISFGPNKEATPKPAEPATAIPGEPPAIVQDDFIHFGVSGYHADRMSGDGPYSIALESLHDHRRSRRVKGLLEDLSRQFNDSNA